MALFQSNQGKFLLILVIGIIAVVIFNGVPYFKSSDTGNYIAIAALFIGAWQVQDARENKIEGAIAALRKELEDAISKVEGDSDRRDSYHDQQLAQIQQQLASLSQRAESHQEDVRRLYEHIFENKDKLAEHGATLAVLGKQGEIILAVNNMRGEFAALKIEVEKVKGSVSVAG